MEAAPARRTQVERVVVRRKRGEEEGGVDGSWWVGGWKMGVID